MYSPIPEVPDPDHSVWRERGPTAGLNDPVRQLPYLDQLAPHVADFRTPPGFALENPYYARVDASCCGRRCVAGDRPRVIEVGAGNSTLVSPAACAANAAEGHPALMTTLDPEPRLELDPLLVLEVLPPLADGVLVHFHDIFLPYE